MKRVTQLHLVLDQGIPREAAIQLRKLGFQCTHVGEAAMAKAADAEILAWALQHAALAVIVTLDADFHAMLAVSRATGPSVIRLRIEGMRAPEVVKVVGRVLEDFGHELQEGAVVTVKAHKITSHRLPIGGWE